MPVGMAAVQVAAAAGVGSWSRTRCRAKDWPGSTSFNINVLSNSVALRRPSREKSIVP